MKRLPAADPLLDPGGGGGAASFQVLPLTLRGEEQHLHVHSSLPFRPWVDYKNWILDWQCGGAVFFFFFFSVAT